MKQAIDLKTGPLPWCRIIVLERSWRSRVLSVKRLSIQLVFNNLISQYNQIAALPYCRCAICLQVFYHHLIDRFMHLKFPKGNSSRIEGVVYIGCFSRGICYMDRGLLLAVNYKYTKINDKRSGAIFAFGTYREVQIQMERSLRFSVFVSFLIEGYF